jgi:hypothetical protein
MGRYFNRALREHSSVLLLALFTLLLHLTVNLAGGYGYFRDEFYYIACSDHLDWGYVDHPPLSIFILWLNRMVLGDSIFALRLVPALSGAVLVVLTGLVTRRLGGGKRARFLACLAVSLAPVYLGVADFFSMNAFEPLLWTLAAYVLLRILNGGDRRLWLVFGVIAGLGLQNKHSMAFFVVGIVLGLLLSRQRKELVSGWFWLGGGVAALIILPNIVWQITHGWPTLEFMRNAREWKNLPMSPFSFLFAQAMFQHPLTFPLWITGLAALYFHKGLRKYSLFGSCYIFLLVFFIAQRGKPYYLSPIYPVILGAGAVAIEKFVAGKKIGKLAGVYAGLLLAGGLATLPMSLPVLPVEGYIRYSRALGVRPPRMERHDETVLPQVFADRFGWEEMVAEVARVYRSLTPEERARASVYAQNYGEAGAVDFFGREYGLPPALCGHNSYWLWGPRGFTGDILIIIGGNQEDHRKVFESVEQAGFHRNPYAMPSETDLPVFVCRQPLEPLEKVWARIKHFE